MITEIVTFDLPADMDRAQLIALFESTVPRWQANDRLIRKQYLYDPATGTGGGVYLWPSRADAEAAHDADWCARAQALYGAAPRFAYFETPVVVDNTTGTVLR